MSWSVSDPSGDPGQHLCVHLGADCQPAAHAEVEARPPSRGIQGDRQSWRVSKARNAEGWPRKVHLDPRQHSKPRTSPCQETHPLPTHRGWVSTPTPCSDLCDSSAPPVAGCPSPGKGWLPSTCAGMSLAATWPHSAETSPQADTPEKRLLTCPRRPNVRRDQMELTQGLSTEERAYEKVLVAQSCPTL